MGGEFHVFVYKTVICGNFPFLQILKFRIKLRHDALLTEGKGSRLCFLVCPWLGFCPRFSFSIIKTETK